MPVIAHHAEQHEYYSSTCLRRSLSPLLGPTTERAAVAQQPLPGARGGPTSFGGATRRELKMASNGRLAVVKGCALRALAVRMVKD
jgi:hypothetical protein